MWIRPLVGEVEDVVVPGVVDERRPCHPMGLHLDCLGTGTASRRRLSSRSSAATNQTVVRLLEFLARFSTRSKKKSRYHYPKKSTYHYPKKSTVDRIG